MVLGDDKWYTITKLFYYQYLIYRGSIAFPLQIKTTKYDAKSWVGNNLNYYIAAIQHLILRLFSISYYVFVLQKLYMLHEQYFYVNDVFTWLACFLGVALVTCFSRLDMHCINNLKYIKSENVAWKQSWWTKDIIPSFLFWPAVLNKEIFITILTTSTGEF